MRHYHIDLFWEHCYFKSPNKDKKAYDKVLNALEFLSKHVKRDANLDNSDFCICFLEAFNMIYPKFFESTKSPAFRQNTLYSFTRMVELLL